MNIAVIGAGYVGLVTGAGLAALGHRVRVGESDPAKLAVLNAGGVPLHEAGLGDVLAETTSNGLLTFHANNNDAIADASVVMIALPTPPSADGSADLATIEAALDTMAGALSPGAVIAMKSTVPVGSVARFQSHLDGLGVDATVVSNPEFLREGSAVHDFFHPDRIVIGSRSRSAAETLTEMYQSVDAPVLVTDPPSSEMIKYASNAYLATRITFANALANLCESVGADASVVLDGMGRDRRIGGHFLKPGPGYGGSCFPKDTKALVSIADDAGYDFSLLRGVIEVNDLQQQRIVDKVAAEVPELANARIGLWGLAFKADTGDTRESPAIKIASMLADRGAMVVAFDPAVDHVDDARLAIADDALGAVTDADVLLVATEWPEFADIELDAVAAAMAGSVVVDARNVLDPAAVRDRGMKYIGVGR